MKYCLWLLGESPLDTRQQQQLRQLLLARDQYQVINPESDFVPNRLAIEINTELPFQELKLLLKDRLIELPLDFVLKTWGRHDLSPDLLIMDMDSTLVQAETIDQIAHHAGVMDKVSVITEAAMRGELDFRASLLKRVAMLQGLSERDLQPVHDALPLTQGAEALIQKANQAGCLTILVSGGFTYFAKPLAAKLGIDRVFANTLGFESGCLTGEVVGEIVDAQFKRRVLLDTVTELGISTEAVIAIGDGANDLPMLNSAGTGIAFHGKPKVQEEASAMINVYGLEAVNWLVGW